ncbi:MAG TPA: P-II family nitrogen regulator [Nitrosopumilaceae archaeon]|nr:P-II family nitrogen regulator [Nitrosopumilaceae archaeon]
MKRIEAFIQSDRLQVVLTAMKKIGVNGITVIGARGQGEGLRPLVEVSRGTMRQVAEFNSIETIVTIVDEQKVQEVMSAIANAASTGSKGDGKIFVSPVDEAMDIGTKKKVSTT